MEVKQQTSIQDLLQQVSEISKKYDENAKKTGENFNVFMILGLSKNELSHTAFLKELLDPKGSHRQGNTYLDLFLKQFKIEGFLSIGVSVGHNYYIGPIDESCENGGFLDIHITNGSQVIVIENKIGAEEQENQLLRYSNYCNTFKYKKLFYLTLDGSATESNIDESLYAKLSYKEDMIAWLIACKEASSKQPIIYEAINAYINLIKHLTNQTENNQMKNEILETIKANGEHVKAALEISRNIGNMKLELMKKYIALQIKNFRNNDGWTMEMGETDNFIQVDIKNDSYIDFIELAFGNENSEFQAFRLKSKSNHIVDLKKKYYSAVLAELKLGKAEELWHQNETETPSYYIGRIKDVEQLFGDDDFWMKIASNDLSAEIEMINGTLMSIIEVIKKSTS